MTAQKLASPIPLIVLGCAGQEAPAVRQHAALDRILR